VKKTARKFRSFSEAEKADRDFYKKLTGNERLQILVELLNHGREQRLERVLELLSSSGVDYVMVGAIIDGIPVFILGRDALIRNKRAVGRPQDLADLSALGA